MISNTKVNWLKTINYNEKLPLIEQFVCAKSRLLYICYKLFLLLSVWFFVCQFPSSRYMDRLHFAARHGHVLLWPIKQEQKWWSVELRQKLICEERKIDGIKYTFKHLSKKSSFYWFSHSAFDGVSPITDPQQDFTDFE